ncbi:PREDICTED: E3 ubiquitin-protein ligase RNF213-like [Leptosomus discolor]|uniref:E3 ubiquitin-protein ligase RNF213-like n=1 Tax=Leptosomus discolor TaxID=188344 RepID=UPI000522BED7|nr:PREDICTED: E3 ubiquitin-protein ligase RNF213-like [Leptosomus discolor]
MESAESDREDESREKPHPVPPSVQEGSCNLLLEKGDDRESKENLGANSSCLENPYLFNERLRIEETMTLEFVAVTSEKFRFSEETSKICVAFYKQPGQYQEFAVLKKRGKVITGHAMIPISDLQRGPIFYKYAILNNVLLPDYEMRLCDLEHIYDTDSKNTESQLHRVINIPKEKIKADVPRKSVNYGIVEHLADEFLQPIRLQKGFRNIERKLKIYTETFKIYLGDAAKGNTQSPINLPEQVLRDNMKKFMDKIIGFLEKEEHKDDGLLFALHILSCYKIPLSKEIIVKAEKLFQDIGPFQGKFKHLRGKRKVLAMIEIHKSLIESCFPLAKTVLEMLALKNFTKDSLLQIKLPPQLLLDTVYQRIVNILCKPSQVHEKDLNGVLNNIAKRMEFWFEDLCLPGSTEQLTNTTNREDAMPCLLSTYALLSLSLKQWHAVPFSLIMSLLRILHMFAAKSDVLQANQQFISERFNEFGDYISEWLEKSLPRPPTENRQFLENINVWHKLFLFEILCVEWTQKWQRLIYSMVERWLGKVDGRKLLDFYLEFMKKDKCWNTNLESCFTDCVIQRIECFEKSEVGKMVSKVLKTNRSTVGKVLSAVIEKIFSDNMNMLEKGDRFVDSTGPILTEVLSSSVVYDLLSTFNSSVSNCISTVLKDRKEEYEQLEEQKKHRRSFLRLCSSIDGVIRVDRSAVEKSISERGSFKDQMSANIFSVNGNKIPKLHFLAKYSEMMKKIHILEESNYFRRLWKQKAKQKAKQIKAIIPKKKIFFLIEDVQENIYKPAIAEFQSTYLALKDFSITLGTVQSHFEKQLSNESQLTKEFKIMERSEGKENGKAAWIDAAVEKIKNYLTLSTVVNTAKMIDELRKTLELNGNFQILNDLTKYEEQEFRNKRLDYMTQDLMQVKNSLSNLPEEMLDFLRELLECTRTGFVSWIKTIIKDKTEIPVFVELASISAGENDIDIDKVRFFRDAMVASAPIIFDLTPTSGFEQLSAALSFISEATAKDNNLPKKLKDSCDNKEWIQMVHDSHGSIECSSISQAKDINSSGIFIVSAPQKFKASLEDCISVLLLKDTTEEASQTDLKAKYSLAQLTELQHKLVLITTKTEQGGEEANRFLEILEKVQMVGKLYLQLLSVGNILFTDWKADIYCNPQHRVKVYTEFGIAGILVQSTRPILEELDGLCKAMEHCLVEWKKYLETQRDTYCHLNLFTAHQLFYLCSQLAKSRNGVIEPQILNMLSVIKHDIKAEDVRKALEQALMTPLDSVNTSAGLKESVTWHDYVIRFPQLIKSLTESGYDTSVAKAALQSCLPNSDITEQKLMNFAFDRGNNKEEVENLSKLYDEQREAFLQKSRKFRNETRDADQATLSNLAEDELATSFESLPSICDKVNLLWDAYCKKFSGLVSDKYISLDVFGETLKQLAALETTCIKRHLPVGLEARKPSLIMCKEEEMLLYMLSVYRHTKTAPLPTYDEVLVCTPDTEEEEVELIVRRALSSDSQNEKIYCLLGAEKLVYKVSKQLESHFFRFLQSSTVPDYRFIIFCNAKAHNSYVITAFDTYKVTIPCYSETEIQAYLSTHLKVPCKSLFVDNTLQKIRARLDDLPVVHKTIRLMESEIDFQFLLEELLSVEEFPTETQPTVFHIDVSPVVSTGLYRLLIELCILRHIQSPDGLVWKCRSSHLYLIECLAKGKGFSRIRKKEMSSETEEKFLDLFPAVNCVSPRRALELLEHPSSGRLSEIKEEQFDQDKLKSEAFQRSYQYLSRYKRKEDLDHFLFIPEMTEGTEKECLKLLLEFCGRHNPSWTELSNFTHFLSFQLSKCEKSVFCSPAVGKDFQGFKTFVVKFMITMSKDFAVPSLDIADESVSSAENDDEENSIIRQYQLRRKWEQESHPYIVFHADNDSMEFLGFHINNKLDAIDAHSQAVLERNVIKDELYRTLKAQHVPFNKKFEDLPRTMQLKALCRVFGVSYTQDPDESYQLTLDNTMKMLAIHLRFQCGIPVIIMGETGCGKTKLIQFMCSLQRAGRDIQNMVVVRVHGGTTSKIIRKKVRQAIELARINEERHKVYTVLFFDEANTSEAIFAIKEVLCDSSINGEKILTDSLKIVAACNPYKRHTKETIEKLEKAGLGYRVRSEDTLEKIGYVPLRQLVYRVKPLPPSLLPLVWDFGELNEKTQSLYIREIVKSAMKNKISMGNLDIFTSVISASQKFLRKKKDECKVASLRDIERCMSVVLWFYKLRDLLFPLIDEKKYKKEQEPILNDAQRALVLSVGACYYVSLESRKDYLEEVAKCFSVPASLLKQEIELCQEVFLDNLSVPEATACNDALRENIFMIVLCMDLRVPLFLVGKPGSSKSLSKTIAVNAMKGRLSKRPLFKRCKEIQLLSFQCSPHSKPEGIMSTFRQCAQFQKGKNLDEFVSVVLLDEIGLAEDSPEMPLKTLHPLLEDGCVDDENPEPYQKVGFVGISNWALDPAKMNRGLLVFRTDPDKEDLIKTAEGICAAQCHLQGIEDFFPVLAEFYCKVLKTQKVEFFGLRDFYSLIKMILSYSQDKNEVYLPPDLETSHTLHLLKENMGKQQAGLVSRYLLLLTVNNAAFHIIQMTQLIDTENCEIIFGSGFPQDQDYSQVCRSVSRVKICMETGRPVVLLNIHNLYESIYDALNQCFVHLGGNSYVDLGLGTHRVKSRVKDEFRLIVIEEKNIVYNQFPTPLLNRLEKHCLDMNTILNWQQQQLKQDLQTWAGLFVSIDSSKFSSLWSTKLSPKEEDVFIGFSNDTCAVVALESTQSRCWGDLEPYEEPVLSIAKRKLIQCATPDSILRLRYSFLHEAEQIQDLYFHKQKHNSLVSVLEETVNQQPRKEKTTGFCLQVSTHARLLNDRDLEEIRKKLKLQNKIHCLFLSQFDTEYTFRQELRYCILDERRQSTGTGPSYVVLATQIPRVLGGCSYLAFDSGEWISIHLDELMPPDNFTGNLGQLAKMTIAEIFMTAFHGCLPTGSPEESAALEDPAKSSTEGSLLSMESMIKQSIQKAIIQLEDKTDNSRRATERITIIHNLLFQDHSRTTLVDANNNLDHLYPVSPFSELWLQMFKEESFLRIKYTSRKQDAKISMTSMTEDPNTSVFCQFPFSWVLKDYLEELWERVYNTKGHPKVPMKEPAELFQALIKNVLMPNGSNPEMMQCYTNDFLRMTFPGQDLSVYEILSKALIVNSKQLCSSVGQEEISFSPIWLHMEYFYLQEEYQLFIDLVKTDETVTSELQKMYEKDLPEMFITLDALNILLKKVQPTDNLLSFKACTEWLRRVKSIKPWMKWISMDNYQIHLYQKKRELLKSVLHQWTCTNIVYMFFDHLLHNETQIDEKLLRLLVRQFIFTWNRLTETQNFDPAEAFELVTKVLKICNENADTVYLVEGVACHNKFRRKCNSFFMEFVTTSVLGDTGTPPPEVITQLIKFVACKPPSPEHQAVKRVCKSNSELSPFEECMDTSPTIKSSLLKLLLRHGFNNIKVHLEKYLSEMEEKITSNKRNWNHFYFMVVHCLEDFMYPSSQDDVNQLAESFLSTADLSAFCSCKASKIDTLQFIARLRFSISHVATVLGRQVLYAADPNIPSLCGNKQEEQDLVNAMKKLVENAQTPWPQTFLIENLCHNYGFIPMQKILQAEKWILPTGVEISEHMGAWSNITLMFSVLDRAENQIKNKDPQEVQRLMPVIKQMENILQTPLLPEEPLENKMKKIVDALCRHKNKVLMEVVVHTAFTLALSPSPLAQLFRNICFKPHVVKFVNVDHTGLSPTSEDKTGKGYILGSPSIRRIELERDLSPASVCLARALLHSSMLLGFYTDKQALDQNLTCVKQHRLRSPQGSNLLLQIAYGQMTPFKDQPHLGLIGLSYMWRFEQKTSIQTLIHLLQQEYREGEGNSYPVLLELMSKLQNIQHVQHLPDIFSLQKALIHFFQNSHGGEIYSIQQFLDQQELSDARVPQDLLPKDINANTAVLKLLPTPLSISYFVTRLLIQLQNSCVETATQITKEKQRIIPAEEVKSSSVLKITENDLITVTMATSQYVIEEDGTKTTHFDFQTLQRQMIQHFISGKPIIKAQEPLSVNQLKQIMEEARSVNAISQTLATLKVAAEFLAVTSGDPERQLSEYVKNELKMDASVEQFRDMPVVPNAQLKHILSLWQTLSAKRSVLLVQMNQNPFCLVSKQYHEDLSAEEEKALTTVLSTVNLDLFLIELHEMIIVPLDSFNPQWGLKETFRLFLEDRQDEAYIANLTDTLSPDLLLKNVVSIWKTAVRTSKLHSPTYIQERPT